MEATEQKVTRKSSTPIKVYCLPEERAAIEANAQAAGLSTSAFLLAVGQGEAQGAHQGRAFGAQYLQLGGHNIKGCIKIRTLFTAGQRQYGAGEKVLYAVGGTDGLGLGVVVGPQLPQWHIEVGSQQQHKQAGEEGGLGAITAKLQVFKVVEAKIDGDERDGE